MSDVIDMACEREQRDRELAIENATRSTPALPPTGLCYYCYAEVPEGAGHRKSASGRGFRSRPCG